MIKIILIILTLLITGYSHSAAQLNDKKCDELKSDIYNLMNGCKSCISSNECFIDEKFSALCPFGCYYIRSRACDNSDKLNLIYKNLEEYAEECSSCIYECMQPPAQDEVGCRNGKCVDLRYYEEK